jgi:hypothetical protein
MKINFKAGNHLITLAAFIFALTGGMSGAVLAQGNASGQGAAEGSQGKLSKTPHQICGGPSAIACPGGMTCIDDPADQCDPREDGAKCPGFCVAGKPAGDVNHPCGGPGNLKCPGGTICVDDPRDKCDPTQDGAKCKGICVVPPPQ